MLIIQRVFKRVRTSSALTRGVVLLLVSTPLGVTAACDKVPLLAPTGSKMSLFAAQDTVPLNGSTTITATLLESAGTPVQNGTVITFTTTLGTIEPREARTSAGSATVRFIAGTQSGTAVINAFSGASGTSGGTTSSTSSTPATTTGGALAIRVGAAVVDTVQLVASPANIPSSGGTVQLTATVLDASGNRVVGVPVSFTTTVGTLSSQQAVTDDSGQARTSLTTTREAKVTARSGSKASPEVTVGVNAAPVLNVTVSPTTAVASQPVSATISPGTGTGSLSNVRIEWGDGSGETIGSVAGSVSRSHSYCAPGAFNISVSATDVNGERANGSAGVAISPVTLSLTASPATQSERRPVTFAATGASAGSIITRYEWNFGDGSPSETTAGPSNTHSYPTQGGYRATVTAIGPCGVLTTATTGVTITP